MKTTSPPTTTYTIPNKTKTCTTATKTSHSLLRSKPGTSFSADMTPTF